jgi:RND family efflux transporter MFP subunit
MESPRVLTPAAGDPATRLRVVRARVSEDRRAATRATAHGVPASLDPDAATAWLARVARFIPGLESFAIVAARDGGVAECIACWPPSPEVGEALINAGRALIDVSARAGDLPPVAVSDGGALAEGQLLALPIGGALARTAALCARVRAPSAQHRERIAELLELIRPSLLQAACPPNPGAAPNVPALPPANAPADTPSVEQASILEVLAATIEHRTLDQAATSAANQLATVLGCQRVTVGLLHEQRIRIAASSRGASFDGKATAAQAIAAAMEEAIDRDSVVVYPAAVQTGLHVDQAHRELASQMSAASLCTVPFAENGELAGAITLEHADASRFDAATVRYCQSVAGLVGPLLESRRREQRGAGARWRDALRAHAAMLVGPTHILPKLVGSSLLLLLLVGLFVTATFRVTADAVLKGRTQRVIVAPVDGFIASASARAGDVVRAGQIIARLDDRALQLEELKRASEYDRSMKEYREAMAELDSAKVAVRRAQLDRAAAELQLAQDNLQRSGIVAPIDGIIVSGDLSQSIGAPTRLGDTLFEIAPLDEYRVELQVDERDVGHLRAGQPGRVVLTGAPGEPLSLIIERITPVSIARDGHNYFEVEARLERMPAALRPGMQGVVKIDAGQRQLLWIWTHRVRDWFVQQLWALTGWSAGS